MSALKKKERNGFSIELHHSNTINNYTVYFEVKGKIVFCYINDFYIDEIFRGKAVCNSLDDFSKQEGMTISFHNAIEKRSKYYDKLIRAITNDFLSMKYDSYKITDKLRKFVSKVYY